MRIKDSEKNRLREEVFDIFEETQDPILTLDEIADRIECSIGITRMLLEDMEAIGMVKRNDFSLVQLQFQGL